MDIYARDLAADETFPITNRSGDRDFVDISGERVVYQDNYDGDWDIVGYDLENDEAFAVINRPDSHEMHPAIDGDTAVFQEERNNSGKTDIWYRDMDTKEFIAVTDSGRASEPDISGDFIVYVEREGGETFIWLFDRYDEDYRRIPSTGRGDRGKPRIDGNFVVWEDEREGAGEPDIWGYDIANGQEFLVDGTEGAQSDPDVSEGSIRIVWQDESRDGDVRGADLRVTASPTNTSTPVPTATSGPPAPRDQRFFFQTGYRVDSDTIWDYFTKRGGVRTFGYPISRTIRFLGFTAQFFQRQILHFDAACQCTQPILLADWFKSVLTANNLPADLDGQMQAVGPRFLRQYDNGSPLGLRRPAELPETNLQNAFEPQ